MLQFRKSCHSLNFTRSWKYAGKSWSRNRNTIPLVVHGIILQNFIPPLRTKSSLVTVPSFHHLPSVQPTSYRSYAGNAIDFAWKSFLACCKTSLKLQSLSDHVGRVKFGVSPVRIQTSMTMTPQLRSDYHVNHLPFVLKLRWGRKTGQILFQFWALTGYRLWSQFWASRYESKTTL